jgi:hypothetical protein
LLYGSEEVVVEGPVSVGKDEDGIGERKGRGERGNSEMEGGGVSGRRGEDVGLADSAETFLPLWKRCQMTKHISRRNLHRLSVREAANLSDDDDKRLPLPLHLPLPEVLSLQQPSITILSPRSGHVHLEGDPGGLVTERLDRRPLLDLHRGGSEGDGVEGGVGCDGRMKGGVE